MTVPTSVTIPANQASAAFLVTAVDDTLVDGTQGVTVTASATGYVSGSGSVNVTDDEGPSLSISVVPASFSENGGTAAGTVTRTNADLGADLVVTLSSTDTSEATVPATVTIPANQSEATFAVSAVDDTLLDGTQTVFVLASAAGLATGSTPVSVTDYETLTVTVTPASLSENGGTATGRVTRNNTDISAALTVLLSSSDTTEATVPASVTMAANQSSVTFTVTGVNDTLLDGTQTATITATATGYVSGSTSVDVTDYETLTVAVSPTSISENGGSATGTVTRNNTDPGAPLTVNLASNDTSEATVPTTVTIPADVASATFPIAAVDDTLKDGTQTVTMTASASGYVSGTRTVSVADYETLTVSISPASMSENGGTATGTVTRNNTDISAALTVSLASSDATEATVPASVTIPANAASKTFAITAVDDLWMDGTQTVTITATASGYVAGTATIDVTDGDVPMLFVTIAAAAISEGAGAGATTATVTRNSGTTDALEVQLSSSDTSEATAPSSVVILAGQSSVQFNIDAVNDAIVDGLQTVVITATAAGHLSATDTVDVRDDEPVLVVDAASTTADTDPLAGSTWEKAYSRLQPALTAARTRNADADPLNNVNEIWVADGTYVAGPARSAGFDMVTNVAVYGGFQGISAAVRETMRNDRARDAYGKLVYETVLSGDLGRNDAPNLTLSQLLSHSSRLDNAYRVVSVSNATNVLLDGLTVTGGAAINITPTLTTNYDGGGILATNSFGTKPVITLNEVLVTGNAAGDAGGAIAGSEATITITNSAIVGNTAGSGGGIGDALYNISSLTVSNSLLAGNVADVGGAISTQAQPTVTQATIVDNVAHYGGGFGKLNGDIDWTGSLLAKNTLIAQYG